MSDYNNQNNDSQGGEGTYVEKFIADLRSRITADKLHGGTSEPVLYPDWYENNLSFIVKTNVPDDEQNNKGKIRFGSDNHTAVSALTTLIKLVTGDPKANQLDQGKTLTDDIVYGFTRDMPAWKDKPVKEINRLCVGRKNGRYFVAIIEENRPQPIFFFGPSKFHRMFINGQEANAQDQSGVYAMSWAEQVIQDIPQLKAKYYETVSELMERWNKKRGGGNGGNNFGGKKPYNGNGGNNGGYKKKWNGNGNGGYKKKWNGGGNNNYNGNGGGYNNNGGNNGGYNGGNGGGNQAANKPANDFDDAIPF